MQSRRDSRNTEGATRARRVSLDLTDSSSEALDRKVMEAIERIERLRSKTLVVVGAMLAAKR